MLTLSLNEFIEPVPVCQQTAGMETVLEIFSSGQWERLVVVSEQQSPLGIVNLRCLAPQLIGKMKQELSEPSSFILHPFIKPIVTVPADFTPSQFWPHLQAIQASSDIGRHWALVDSLGKFLGLLDSWLLLRFLAPTQEGKTPVATRERCFVCRDERTEKASDETLFIAALKPLIQLLEQIPLPLRLQTVADQVISHNLSWCQQIGEELPGQKMLDDSWKEQFRNPVPVPSFYPTRQEPLEATNYEVAPPYEQLICSAGDFRTRSSDRQSGKDAYTPALLQDSSLPSVAVASSLPLRSASVDPVASEKSETFASFAGKLKNNQGRVFSFVKIPLNALGVGDADENLDSCKQNEQFLDANPGLYMPSLAREESQNPNFPKLVLVLAQDVTEQQQVAKELMAKNADLIQVNRFKDEFLACISHELKTPLTAVLGLSSLLKDQLVGQLNERQAHYAQLIHQSGRTLMTVVNDILDLTRIETGCLELTPEPVNIRSVCDRAYLQTRQQLVKNEPVDELHPKVPFTLNIEAGLETIVADELRLRQMLGHLLSNALKFTDTGGEIGLKVSRWGGWVAFTVWDTGIGIPDAKQHLIFQKFQQLENPLTRRFEGTGLGLVLTQRLTRLHGGDVSFISKAGKGSQFTLLLPPVPPQKSVELSDEFKDIQNSIQADLIEEATNRTGFRQDQRRPDKSQRSLSRLVLIVEAAPQYTEDLTEQLIDFGYRVVIARSGTEAIEKARRLQPQIVFLNPLLPQLSGWDVLTLLKSDVQTRHIPVVVTTTQAERELALSNRADDFLSLPVQEEALHQSLTNLATKQLPITCTNLTLLSLKPFQTKDREIEATDQTDSLLSPHLGLNCRVLEADDLEQAELLARVWHPDVLLLDGVFINEPLAYLEELSSHTSLASLPLVTLDHHTTKAANQVTSLSVYPCLAPTGKDKTAALWQVIQVAAGMSCNPSILVVNLAILPDVAPSDFRFSTFDFGLKSSTGDKSKLKLGPEGEAKSQDALERRELASLQALNQYLQTAGFRSLLSRSWAEVCRQLQHQSADLLLIHLSDGLPNHLLFAALTSLANIPALPPILVLDHRANKEKVNNLTLIEVESAAEVESFLRTVPASTQLLQGSSQSMAELLDKISQMLRAF